MVSLEMLIFYSHREFCDARGWEQPVISSLGVEGIPPVKET